MSEKRADVLISEQFPDLSRSKIQSLIKKQKVYFKDKNEQWTLLAKPGQSMDPATQWKVGEDEELQFVSRAGLKLLGALKKFQLDVSGFRCLDVGLSTGGFSDCLLQNGAESMVGIDVGSEQLHEKLRDDRRLVWQDKINARQPLPEELVGENFDLIVIDISFISLDKVFSNLVNYLKPGGLLLPMVKPQFELDRSRLNKKGVVKDDQDNERALQKNIEILSQLGLKILGTCPSPIEGENGNQEFFILAKIP